jgi:ATP-dependent DNA helicase RecQ
MNLPPEVSTAPHLVLREALARGTTSHCTIAPSAGPTVRSAINRLLVAWQDSGEFGADEAVLLRQVVRWNRDPFFVGDLSPSIEKWIDRVGIQFSAGFLSAEPFRPPWLEAGRVSLDELPQTCTADERVPCEAFRPGNYGEWHSQAQKEAAWASITAPPGSTTLIALPTGAGKSTCFHVLPWLSQGLTVVIVPTVALAIDQQRKAQSVLESNSSVNPLYYASGDASVDPRTVVEAVRSNRTRLLFTSPEACVSGTLKQALADCAEIGHLANVVVDEAHLIETWGMFFRVDFQLLAAERRKWLCASQNTLRTLLLSATFTPASRHVLQHLFHDEGQEWRQFISQRLRPEVNYFFRQFNAPKDRDDALIEAAWMLPRPAIFYTTEPVEADNLKQRLISTGFRRVSAFHGGTLGESRRELIYSWTDDKIDVMVATSAFGVGVDKPDVRTIVHACLPENLNRFYQEVGRGGRDGSSSISLLLPTPHDAKVAKGLAPKLMRPNTLQERWKALLLPPSTGKDHKWRLFPAARRTALLGTHTGSENILWNKRLVLQLQRVGKLDIDQAYYGIDETSATNSDWIDVTLKFPAHTPDIAAEVAPVRAQELRDLQKGYEEMEAVLDAKECLGNALRRLYGKETVKVCGSCPWCRQNGRHFSSCPPLLLPPARVPEHPAVVIVVHDWPHPFRQASGNRFVDLLRQLVTGGKIRRFACASAVHHRLMELFNKSLGHRATPLAFRLDSFSTPAQEPDFLANRDETLLIFHIDAIVAGVADFAGAKKIVHAICGFESYGQDGRFYCESSGARLLPDPTFLVEES